MVSFMDIYFHFLANFQTLTPPHMFSIFTGSYVMLRDTHSESGLAVVCFQQRLVQFDALLLKQIN